MGGIALWLAAAAGAQSAYTLPVPLGSPADWVTSADYPKDALRAAERGYVPIRLVVSPAGLPIDCKAFTQSPVLAKATCRLLVERARFRPAVDEAGRAYHGIYESQIAYRMGGLSMPPRVTSADIVLTVDRLPAGSADPVTVPIAFLVDADGRIGACGETSGHPAADPLVPLACQEARRTGQPASVRIADGARVPSVQALRVLFRTPCAAPGR